MPADAGEFFIVYYSPATECWETYTQLKKPFFSTFTEAKAVRDSLVDTGRARGAEMLVAKVIRP